MNVHGVEHIQFNALGGVDNVTVRDLSGTGVTQVTVDLGVNGAGDGLVDHVTVNGSGGNDQISVFGSGTEVSVLGLAAQVNLEHPDGDGLMIKAGGGNDTINASTLPAGLVGLTIDGGAGSDTIIGSQGADRLLGGDGNDTVIGGRGNDVASLGNGNDTFIWNPGDASDVVEGQAGTDTLVFNGADIAEQIELSANGQRLRLTRDIGTVVMDVNGVEHVQVNALDDADTITVNDLTGTSVNKVNIDLGARPGGAGDGKVDTVVINATNGNDVISLTRNNGVVTVSGLGEDVTIRGFDANDRIVINGLAGDDVITAFGFSGMQVTENGGDGHDLLVGSLGNDALSGDNGDDILIGGGGQDALDGGPGANLVFNSPTVAPRTALLVQAMASTFSSASQGQNATPLPDPDANQAPLLAQPQHA
jgi:Ca2+-binding RTX toxin-like protein